MQQWRGVVDEYTEKIDHAFRVLMVEAYANNSMTMKYYIFDIHFPFNFRLMDIKNSAKAADVKNILDVWMSNMPAGVTVNWVVSMKCQVDPILKCYITAEPL